MVTRHNLLFNDVKILPVSTYTFMSQNKTATRGWFNLTLSSKREIVSQVKVLHGETFGNHIPIYCEHVFL